MESRGVRKREERNREGRGEQRRGIGGVQGEERSVGSVGDGEEIRREESGEKIAQTLRCVIWKYRRQTFFQKKFLHLIFTIFLMNIKYIIY